MRKENGVMITDRSWKKAYVLSTDIPEIGEIFSAQLFYTHAVQRHILYLHSSLIDYQGHGLMFLGPSGIGKTTQAELWNQYRDALIIKEMWYSFRKPQKFSWAGVLLGMVPHLIVRIPMYRSVP